jgi:predicted nucleotidyltransferase
MLFGSRARGTSNPDSDYDFLFIIPRNLTPKEKIPYKTQIRRDLLSYGIRADILIQSHEEVNTKKKLPGHVIRNVLKDAIQL